MLADENINTGSYTHTLMLANNTVARCRCWLMKQLQENETVAYTGVDAGLCWRDAESIDNTGFVFIARDWCRCWLINQHVGINKHDHTG